MRQALQYAYSIAIFCGVIVTAYLAIQKESDSRLPLRAVQSPAFQSTASFGDPAVQQLSEVQDLLSEVKQRLKTDKSDKRNISSSGF